jgi:hypothetical protein
MLRHHLFQLFKERSADVTDLTIVAFLKTEIQGFLFLEKRDDETYIKGNKGEVDYTLISDVFMHTIVPLLVPFGVVHSRGSTTVF